MDTSRDFRADPRVGDLIVPRYRYHRVAREIIRVTDTHVETTGLAGGMRNRWMKREGLKRYDLSMSAEDSAALFPRR